VANPVSRSTITNKVVWGRTSTKVNLLSRILLRINLDEPKVKSKKMSPTDPAEEEERVEAEPRSKKEEENLGKASPKGTVIHTYYHAVLLSLMISQIRWVT
jgi:hypothetical protein